MPHVAARVVATWRGISCRWSRIMAAAARVIVAAVLVMGCMVVGAVGIVTGKGFVNYNEKG